MLVSEILDSYLLKEGFSRSFYDVLSSMVMNAWEALVLVCDLVVGASTGKCRCCAEYIESS